MKLNREDAIKQAKEHWDRLIETGTSSECCSLCSYSKQILGKIADGTIPSAIFNRDEYVFLKCLFCPVYQSLGTNCHNSALYAKFELAKFKHSNSIAVMRAIRAKLELVV